MGMIGATYTIVILQELQVLELVLTKGVDDLGVLDDIHDLLGLSLRVLQLVQNLLASLDKLNGYFDSSEEYIISKRNAVIGKAYEPKRQPVGMKNKTYEQG
jgi:hypothetical protein